MMIDSLPELLMTKEQGGLKSAFASYCIRLAAKVYNFEADFDQQIESTTNVSLMALSRSLTRLAISVEHAKDKSSLGSLFAAMLGRLSETSDVEQSILFELVSASSPTRFISIGDRVILS